MLRRSQLLLGSILSYFLYYRWKHGNKVARHTWKVAGFPEEFWTKGPVRPKVVGGCEPDLCFDDDAPYSPIPSKDGASGTSRVGRAGGSL
jgi:hypothetical protein